MVFVVPVLLPIWNDCFAARLSFRLIPGIWLKLLVKIPRVGKEGGACSRYHHHHLYDLFPLSSATIPFQGFLKVGCQRCMCFKLRPVNGGCSKEPWDFVGRRVNFLIASLFCWSKIAFLVLSLWAGEKNKVLGSKIKRSFSPVSFLLLEFLEAPERNGR